MGAGAVSDGGHGQFHHAADLPRYPRRRRGAGIFGGGPLGLQMVSRREADPAHRDTVAGIGVRRDPRGAGAELGDRQPYLALCLRRARRRRPDVGGGVADPGQGGAAGSNRRPGGGRSPRALFPASDVANLHRLLRCDLRRLLGAVARPDLVHALHCQGSRLLAKGRRLDFDPAMGVRRRHRVADRVDFAGADGARLSRPAARAACSARCR